MDFSKPGSLLYIRMCIKIVLTIFILSAKPLFAQTEVDNKSIVGENRYIEFKFQNDFFFKTDYYYSNGVILNFVFPEFKKSPLNKLLIPLKKKSLDYYGISLVQKLYTPENTNKQSIIYNDRPYSSLLYLGHKRSSFIADSKSKITNELIVGIIGRYSFGHSTQAYFHEAINNNVPAGWNNQVANDLILNYEFSYEPLMHRNKYAEFTGLAVIRAGTLYDDLTTGFTLRIGYFNAHSSGFGQSKPSKKESIGLKKFQIYAYIRPSIKAVFYNGALQGGIFNQSSPFTLTYQKIEPVVLTFESAFVLQYSTFQLNIQSEMLSPEFKNGNSHKWLSIGLQFNF